MEEYNRPLWWVVGGCGYHAHLGIDMLLLMKSWCVEEMVEVILKRIMVESEGLGKEGVSV